MLNSIAALYGTGAAPVAPTAYESIATVTVGSGGVSSVTFNSFSGYTHLQIRFIAQNSGGTYVPNLTFNGDTGTNYSYHRLGSYGSGVFADAGTSQTSMQMGLIGSTSNVFSGGIIDILDYANTNKYKTVKSLGGFDENGGGFVLITSGNWRSTSAVTSLTLTSSGFNFTQYSSFALYGVK